MSNRFLKLVAFSVCMSLLMNSSLLNTVTVKANESIEQQYSAIESRGVWHRPNADGRETDLAGICSVLDEMVKAGINMVFVESFYHGMTVFKTNLVPYYTGFEKYDFGDYPDYLTAFSEEAHKRGIEVHAWVESFYLGVNENTPLVKYFPDWLLLNEHGKINHTTEGADLGGYIFLDPANKDARAYLLRFYEELLDKVPCVDGLNLDYIRYPVSDFYSGTDTGYTDTAITEFSEKYGLSVNDNSQYKEFKNQIAKKSLVDEWIKYRADQVSDFVGEVSNMVRIKHPHSIISVAVHPDISGAYNQKKQDFSAWVDRGYIDVVTPMVYYYSSSQISSALKTMLSKFDGVYCYSGLYTTYHNQSTSELNSHINASKSSGSDGFVLFESVKTFFKPANDYAGYLSDSYGKNAPAALPHWSSERLIKAAESIIANKLTEGGADATTVARISEKMESIAEIGEGSAERLDETISELTKLKEGNLFDAVGEKYASDVKATLDKLLEYLEIRQKRLSFKGYTDNFEDEPDDSEQKPEDDNDESTNITDAPNDDTHNSRSFFDAIKMLINRITDWFRSFFSQFSK